ncbi:MAG: hypothetical protein NZ480_04075 [Bdellovibrionaceae bacterium]|nr:hypothetical protein [Pseudobdellovibrionaceae bacterium]MDW8190801.1 hypothetical protein [Pseudobdellovibrionaceae bacterium]
MTKLLLKYSNSNPGLGITLIEVLIAMTILAVMTALSAQSLRQGFTIKEKIQKNLDSSSRIRDAINLINQDLKSIVNYEDLELRFYEAVKKQARQQIQKSVSSPTRPPNNPREGAPPDHNPMGSGPSGNPVTQQPPNLAAIQEKLQQLENRFPREFPNRKLFQTVFRGSSDKVFFFTTNNLIPPGAENPIPPFLVRVSYQIKSCPDDTSKNCLIRYVAPASSLVSLMELERFPPGTPILKDVTSFEIKYRGALQQDWVTQWNSEANVMSQKAKVPEAVSISLKVGNQSVNLTTYLMFPNNRYETRRTNSR